MTDILDTTHHLLITNSAFLGLIMSVPKSNHKLPEANHDIVVENGATLEGNKKLGVAV